MRFTSNMNIKGFAHVDGSLYRSGRTPLSIRPFPGGMAEVTNGKCFSRLKIEEHPALIQWDAWRKAKMRMDNEHVDRLSDHVTSYWKAKLVSAIQNAGGTTTQAGRTDRPEGSTVVCPKASTRGRGIAGSQSTFALRTRSLAYGS